MSIMYLAFFLKQDDTFSSPLYLILVIAYFLAASVSTFDTRLIQARRQGEDFGALPPWTIVFDFIMWGLWLFLAFLDWKNAIGLFILKFILKFLPVLETIGGILMAPFVTRDQR